jgi:hypothetical protein
MSDTEESAFLVAQIARESVALIDDNVATAHESATPADLLAGAALSRLARLLDNQLRAGESNYEILALCARASIETWLTGHAALLLGESGMQLLAQRMTDAAPPLEHIAQLLDTVAYGESEQPKAFRRHLRSFFDEVDVAGSEGTMMWLARYVDGDVPARVRVSPLTSDEPIDFVRVGLWVTLFLAHDYFAAVGPPEAAKAARALFDRLRGATGEFYARRKVETARAARPASS